MASTIWVNKKALTQTKIHQNAQPDLAEGAIRLQIESFSVTANNVTYAVVGDLFGYWGFFPAEGEMGVVPVWGHAVVEKSQNPEISVGERVYGYLPMGTHLDVHPGRISASGFTDMAAHRQPMSPIYNQYSRLNADPEHDPAKQNERMVFGPLFKTGFLIEAMFRREDWFGAQNLVMTSASSKTAMGLASVAKDLSPTIKRIGLTSSGNVDFVQATGLYDQVLAYGDLAMLAQMPSVAVDFAGNAAIGRAVHARLADTLNYSCAVGMTHVGARTDSNSVDGNEPLPGPAPILFFAPDHAMATINEVGPKGFGEAVATSWRSFLAAIEGKVTFEQNIGIESAAKAFIDTLEGRANPAVGIIIQP
jgi:hypothetical protein